MNRPIKFRVWDKKNKNWAIDFDISLDGELLCDGGTTLFIREHFEIMQFTGLLDCEGKEIYEGDIIEDGFDRYIINSPSWFECDAFECYGYDNLSGRFYGNPLGEKSLESIKIIGNIYEHPHLLEE